MKQFRTLISITLSIVLCFTGLIFSGVSGNIDVAAAAVVCTASLPFEVSVITAKDVYTVNACYATLAAAQTALNTLSASTPNVVVRHPASQSPSKIIAMDRGIATSYGYRTSTSSTLYLYPSYNTATLVPNGSSNYIQNNIDMQYLGTMGFNTTNGTGIIKIKVSGYVGYISIVNSDLIPMIYLDNGWLFTMGGPVTSPYKQSPFTVVPKMNIYVVKTVSYDDVTTGGVASKTARVITHGRFSMFNSATFVPYVYGPAPSWLSNGTYYSWDGINYYTDRDCKKPVYNGSVIGHYYQYFQYLPLRSYTNYTGSEIDAYLEIETGFTKGPTIDSTTGKTVCIKPCSMLYHQGANFITSQNTYGMNALLVFSLAYHESGGGTSAIGINKYNLFGWGAVDSNPYDGAAVFTSIAQSVNEMMGVNLRAYISPERSVFDGSVFGSKNSGINVHYASDLQWGEKIAGRAYTMDRWLGGKDYGAVDYAIFNDGQTINVEKTEGSDTANLYTLPSMLKDESLILQSNNRVAGKLWARTPSTVPVSSTGAALLYTDTRYALLPYDRVMSKGFLIVNNYYYMVPRLVDGKTTNLVQTLAWNANKLSIAGYGFVNGYNAPNIANAAHTLNLTSDTGVKSIVLSDGAINEQLTTDFGKNLVSYDGTTYNSPAIDVSAFAPGTYTFGLTLAEASYGVKTALPFNYAGGLPADMIINGKFYKFQRLSDGTIKLNITYAIILTSYVTTPTNKNITVNASIANWTLNAASHTFTENGSFTFTATDGKGGSVDRIVTIDNIDKTLPIITVDNYLTTPTNQNIIISVSTNEGSLNAISHTFTANGSFDFVAIDAAGNTTTKTITITNIDKTAPIISGVSSGTYYKVNKTITFNEGTALLDGVSFTTGATVSTERTHTLAVTDSAGNISTVTFTIDKTLPIITIGAYPTTMQDNAITVTATTNEGTLNTASHTFQVNGSFSFIATDAAGNVTTKVVTITNINAKYAVDFSVAQGHGTLTALVGTTVLKTGDLLTPNSTIIFTVIPATGYVVTQWTLNGTAVLSNLTKTLTVPNITASVAVTVKVTMYGDVNNDGKLSTTDIVMLRRYLAGLGTLTDLGKIAGDYNKDGKISTTDIVMMRRKLAGLE